MLRRNSIAPIRRLTGAGLPATGWPSFGECCPQYFGFVYVRAERTFRSWGIVTGVKR